MRNLIIILSLILSFYSCSGKKSEPSVNVTDDTTTPEITDPVEIETTIKILTFYDNNIVKWYDGSVISIFKSGDACHSDSSRQIAIDNKMYDLDNKGNITATDILTFHPDIINGDYQVRNVPPDEATAAGYMSGIYTAVYFQGAEIGDWGTRKYETTNLYLYDSSIILKKSTGAFVDITGTYNNINAVSDNIVIHDFDAVNRTAKINGVPVSWATNYMNSAADWIYCNGKYYSQNGYTFDGVTLNENGSAMTVWRTNTASMTGFSEQAVIKFCGIYLNEIYFVECNSGILFKYNPVTDVINQVVELYDGDGIRANGLIYKNILQPCMNNTYMFFRFGNGLYRMRWDNLLVAYLTSCNSWIKIW